MELFESHEIGEACLLVNFHFNYRSHLNADIEELKGLVSAASWDIKAVIDATRKDPDPKYFCGLGKLEEIKQTKQHCGADLVVFNHSLTPSQERNIEKFLECKVIDRTRLILEIFAQRAQTHEGKLQVELAQLNYQSTRLVRGWTHLERQKGGIGVRGGPGETQLELDRRLIRQRIRQIEQKLDKVKMQRSISRASRKKQNVLTLAFVGYTNAGKSTLFNYLSGADVYAKDQLFATLDPTLRSVEIPKLGEVILSDTVGFIRNLPHDLIDAFKATLEEAIEADLLLHVIDYADPEHHAYIEQVELVLDEIGVADKPRVEIYNKIDRIDDIKPHIVYHDDVPQSVYLSAQSGIGCDLLYEAIARYFHHQWVKEVIILPPHLANIRAKLYQMGVIEKEMVDDEGNFQLSLNIAKKDFENLEKSYKIDWNQFLKQKS